MKMKSIVCPGCGVPSFVDPEKDTIVFCPYCGTKIMLNDSTSEDDRTDQKPDGGEEAEGII